MGRLHAIQILSPLKKSQTIHMKHKALFSSENHKIIMQYFSSAAAMVAALKANNQENVLIMHMQNKIFSHL